MSKKPTRRRYASVMRGLRLTLPEKLSKKLNQRSILFSDDNPVFETEDPEVQEFIESHRAFKTGVVSPEKTKEEIEYEKKQKEYARAREELRAMYIDGALIIDEKLPEKALVNMLKRIGLSGQRPAKDGKVAGKMTKKEMVEALKNALKPEGEAQSKEK